MPRIETVPVGNSTLVQIEIDRGLLTRLRPEARARNTSTQQLVRDLLEVIATDRLVGAVLDDQRAK